MAGTLFLGYWFAADTRVIVCRHVLEGSPPALIAHHGDGDIQILCNLPFHEKADAGFVELGELLFAIPELEEAPNVRPGEWGLKDGLGPWRVALNPED